MTTPMRLTLRGFASRWGCAHSLVVRAVQTGRLARSIGREPDGTPYIANIRLADYEWEANSSRPVKPRPRS